MSHRRLLILLLWCCVLIPVSAQDSAPLFSADFDDDVIPDALNIQYGTYEINDGQLDYTVSNGGFLVIPSGIDWTDYAIETQLTILDGSVWIQARTDVDLCSGYYLTLNPAENIIDLSLSDRDCNFTVLDTADGLTVPEGAFTVRVDVMGENIRAYLDDELILSATDAQFASGYPTINVFPTDETAHILFDSILVTALSADIEQVEPTVEPTQVSTSKPTIEPIAKATDEAVPLVDVDLPAINEIPLGDDPNRMIESMVELGLIPDAEGELYTTEGVTIARIGAWFEPLFDDTSSRHAVMSGDIFFLPNNEAETCLLSARIERDERGIAQRYLDVGINALDEVFIGETADNGEYSLATQEGILTASGGNILFVAYGDRLSVYVNGRAVFQNVAITRRDGSFGVSSNTTTSYSVCHVTNLWVYTFEG